QLPDIKEVTHIIFSSTIPVKYEILAQLFELTNDCVVVAMRYGDGMKAIFNYPSQFTASDQWQCVHQLVQPNQIFDVALYQKVSSKAGVTYV
ncbi:SAM-dependent methyltransferase, partial [Staphylococcus epidermidis]